MAEKECGEDIATDNEGVYIQDNTGCFVREGDGWQVTELKPDVFEECGIPPSPKYKKVPMEYKLKDGGRTLYTRKWMVDEDEDGNVEEHNGIPVLPVSQKDKADELSDLVYYLDKRHGNLQANCGDFAGSVNILEAQARVKQDIKNLKSKDPATKLKVASEWISEALAAQKLDTDKAIREAEKLQKEQAAVVVDVEKPPKNAPPQWYLARQEVCDCNRASIICALSGIAWFFGIIAVMVDVSLCV
jgi:hypothetical protein